MKSIRKLKKFLCCLKQKNIGLWELGFLMTKDKLSADLKEFYESLVKDYTDEPLDVECLKGYASIWIENEPTIQEVILAKIILDLEEVESFISLKDNVLSNKVLDIYSELRQHFCSTDNLFLLKPFEILPDALEYKDKVIYTKLPYPLVYNFMSYSRQKGMQNKIKASLSANIIERSSYKTYLHEERVYGLPFSLERIKNLAKKEYGEFQVFPKSDVDKALIRAFYIPVKKMEYVFNPVDKELISLSIEELIDIDQRDTCARRGFVYFDYDNAYNLVKTRFLHSLFNIKHQQFEHFDCVYHFYKENTYILRLKQHLKSKTVDADYRIKLFRIDGIIDYLDWANFSALFFDKDPLIDEFLRGE